MTLITEVRLARALDSRGNATVEAEIHTESGGVGRALAPSGASTGEHEAIELPADEAIAAAREHAVPRLEGQTYAGDQRSVDRRLRSADGTGAFERIGANSAVAISMAAAKAAADVLGAPLYQHLGGAFRGSDLPIPLGNVLGGGAHAADATDIQEFLAVPTGAPSATDAVFANAEVHRAVAAELEDRGVACGKGDEGAWAPSITDETAFEVVTEAIATVEGDVGFDIRLGLDVAASELYDPETETYRYTDRERTADEQMAYMADLVAAHDVVYLEDPLDENDFEGFATLTDRIGAECLICGDDLFVTAVDRIRRGVETDAGNSVLIKPNQIGTLTDAFDAIELAREHGYTPVISHRSGETEDTTIAHLAVAVAAPHLKTGAVGGERTAKLNELMRIERTA